MSLKPMSLSTALPCARHDRLTNANSLGEHLMPFPQRSRKTPPDTRPWRRVHPFLVTLSIGLTLLFIPSLARATDDGVNVLTFHGDNARLGWNAHEMKLTPSN